MAGNIEERRVRLAYLTTGEPATLLRVRGTEQVTRPFVYDTLGRMVLNQEPNVGAWRFVYCDAGATCEAHHEGYDSESEVGYLFDLADRPQPAPRGHFGEASRRVQRSWTSDWLGNTVSTDDGPRASHGRSSEGW